MHSVLWASIFASAGVALVTTLLVEYFAKPTLEARKERILEKKRGHRTALRDLARAMYLADNILHARANQKEPLVRKKTVEFAEDIERLVFDSYERLRVPRYLFKDWTDVSRDIIGIAMLIRERPLSDEQWEEFSSAYDMLEQYYFLAEVPAWNQRKRFKMIHEIESSKSDSQI
jgi:hypothetical protein